MHIAIVGNGIVANLTALFLVKKLPPDIEISLIGSESRGGLPIVGESTIEITARFLEEQLHLGQYLRQNHYPKYALTYYFKIDPSDAKDRRYSVHCNERAPEGIPPLPGWDSDMARPPAWQLNRTVFDHDLKKFVEAKPQIRRIFGIVKTVELGKNSPHLLTVHTEKDDHIDLNVDWVIDATGRKQLLAKKLDLVVKPEIQRDCFWLRLADFDRELLSKLVALGPPPPAPGDAYHYDRYYSTHHFMGKGNWIWLIPLKGETNTELISIGLVSRPDIYEGQVTDMDCFLSEVEKVHPVVTDIVRSGKVVDTNVLKRYHYVSKQVYSADRWGIIGDAAFAPDPLFSNGLAFCSIQIEQLTQLILEDQCGKLTEERATALSNAFMAPVLSSQTAIGKWYETMDDPFLSALRLNWIEVAYYYMLLPLVVNRCHYEKDRMKLWKILQFRPENNSFEIPDELLQARKKIEKISPEHFLYWGKTKVNPRAFDLAEDLNTISMQIEEGGRLRRQYVIDVLAHLEKSIH